MNPLSFIQSLKKFIISNIIPEDLSFNKNKKFYHKRNN